MADEKQREQARAHARFTRQRKQELIDKLQSQYDELLKQRVQSEAKAQWDVAQTRLLKQKLIQLLDMWSDNDGPETRTSTSMTGSFSDPTSDIERNALLDPEVRALLPFCYGNSIDDSAKSDDEGCDQTIREGDLDRLYQDKDSSSQNRSGEGISLLKVIGDNSTQRSLVGIDAIRKGVASLSLQPERLGLDSCGVQLQLRFAVEVAIEAIFIGKKAAMCPFWYRSFNAKKCGASREVELRGMLYCEFRKSRQQEQEEQPDTAARTTKTKRQNVAQVTGETHLVSDVADIATSTAASPTQFSLREEDSTIASASPKTIKVSSRQSQLEAETMAPVPMDETSDATHSDADLRTSPSNTRGLSLEETTRERLSSKEGSRQQDQEHSIDSPTISGVRLVYDCLAWNREIAASFAWEIPTMQRDMVIPANLNQALAAMAANGGDKAMLLTTVAHPRKVLRVTERYCKLTGYHPRELLGNALMWLDPPAINQRARLFDLVDDLKAGYPLIAIMQHPTNLPSTKTGSPLYDQNGILTLTQAYPLAELTRSETALKTRSNPPSQGSATGGEPQEHREDGRQDHLKCTDLDDPTASTTTKPESSPPEDSGNKQLRLNSQPITWSSSAHQKLRLQEPATHVLWVLREPPEPKVSPCVSALLELAVRVARALHVELSGEDTAFCAEMHNLLHIILVEEPPPLDIRPSMLATISSPRSAKYWESSFAGSSSMSSHRDVSVNDAAGLQLPADSPDFSCALDAVGAEADTPPPSNATTPTPDQRQQQSAPLSYEELVAEARERQVVVTMWDLYKHTRLRWSKVSTMTPSERQVTKTLGTIWSRFFAQVRAAGAGEPFASFVDRAKHYGVDRRDETVSFILRRFASLALNFHRDWVSNGKINDSLADDKIPEVERAVAVYTKVIDTWPKYAEAWNRRARAFFLLGNYDAAAADLRQAIHLEPNNASAWIGKMLVCMKHKKYAAALDAYKQAIKLSPALDIGYRAADL